jgi:hypothetical protein
MNCLLLLTIAKQNISLRFTSQPPSFLYDKSRYQANNFLSYHRVNNPGQHQPGHRDKQGPEHFFDLLVLPERIDGCDGPYIRTVTQRPA